MQEHEILVKQLPVTYKTIGDGEPLLILHGWGSSSEKWVATAQHLAQHNVKCIIPDLPGFGNSQEPKSAWGLDQYLDWLLEFTGKVPELGRDFNLLGHSFGGAIAVKFTIKYNQRIKKLTLVGAAIVRKKTGGKKFYYYLAKLFKVFSFIPGYELFRKAVYKFVIRKSDYIHTGGVMQETYLKAISEDLSWRLPFVKVPTTIIWGDKDELTPLDQAGFINEKIPHSKLVVIPGAPHGINVKMPEALAEKILEGLKDKSYHEQLLSLKNII